MNEEEMLARGKERRAENPEPSLETDRRVSISDRRFENNRQYATFYLDDHFLGIEIEQVQEVFLSKEMTSVPKSPASVAGLINLRGQIIMSIDLRKRLGFKENSTGEAPMSIVVRTSDGPVNLLVDQIGDVIRVRPDLFELPPKTLEQQLGMAIEGVYKLEGKLLLALNTECAVQVA